jgi:NADH-quinone oxidoreductase subunit N
MTSMDLYGLAPCISLTVVGALALLLEVAGIPVGARRRGPRGHIAVVTVVGIAVAAALAASSWDDAATGVALFGGQVRLDRFGIIITLVACASALIGVMVSVQYLRARDLERGEVYALVAFTAAGMSVMGMSSDLLVLFVALEVLSVGVYALTGLDRDNDRSAEAALKYFINGAFAAGVLLFGMALAFGATGSTSMQALADTAARGTGDAAVLARVGLALVLAGIGFKAAVIPFHGWVPDVYEGAPAPVTAFMSAGVKAVAFAALLRLCASLVPAQGPAADVFVQLAWVAAVATMTLGNLAALAQRRIKRMLAYSSVAHAGYVLVGVTALLAGRGQAVQAVAFYLVAYGFLSLGAFGVVAFLERKDARRDRQGNSYEEWSGAARRYPAAGLAMCVFMFGLAGVPPTAGFVGKLDLFLEAVRAGLLPLVIIAVLNSLVSVYFYLRVLVFMYMKEPDRDLQGTGGPWLVVGVATAAAAVMVLGITPSRYLELAQAAVVLVTR